MHLSLLRLLFFLYHKCTPIGRIPAWHPWANPRRGRIPAWHPWANPGHRGESPPSGANPRHRGPIPANLFAILFAPPAHPSGECMPYHHCAPIIVRANPSEFIRHFIRPPGTSIGRMHAISSLRPNHRTGESRRIYSPFYSPPRDIHRANGDRGHQ